MPSKIFTFKIILLISIIFLQGCFSFSTDENNIGARLNELSAIQADEMTGQTQIALFDRTARKIHKFDIKEMTHLNSYELSDAEKEHYVFYTPTGDYILDLSKKQLSVIKGNNEVDRNILKLAGEPKSASFNSKHGLFLVYDSLNNVGLIQFSHSGDVIKRRILGSEIGNGLKIQSGDIDSSGFLIASLSNGQLAKIDLLSTLSSSDGWAYTILNISSLPRFVWISKVPGVDSQILAHNGRSVYLIDTQQEVVLDKSDSLGFNKITSRSYDPHLVSATDSEIKIIYTQNSLIKERSLFLEKATLQESYLNVATGTWSFIYKLNYEGQWTSEDKVKMEFAKVLLDQGMATEETLELPTRATHRIAESYLFSLVDSKLGYAMSTELNSFTKKELKHFNVKHLKPR